MTAYEIQEAAYAAFDTWVAANDPDGEMTLLKQIEAYAKATE